jgi:hypothetical protein
MKSIHYGGVKTKQQMADEYGICRKTFSKWLVKKNIRLGRGLISPRDQLAIYTELGDPLNSLEFPIIPKNSPQ